MSNTFKHAQTFLVVSVEAVRCRRAGGPPAGRRAAGARGVAGVGAARIEPRRECAHRVGAGAVLAAGRAQHRAVLLGRWARGALYERPRLGAAEVLAPADKQRIIAMVCADPPAGAARWNVRLITEQAVKRKLVDQVGRETIRVLLQRHDLTPWRE